MLVDVKWALKKQYYEYILVYIDDIRCISYDPMNPMHEIASFAKVKKDEIIPAKVYLGA